MNDKILFQETKSSQWLLWATLLLLIPFISLGQGKKTFYEDGVIRGDSIFDENGKLKILRYYHKNGNLQLESFYEASGAFSDFYALDEKGDTTLQSQIPLLKKQPPKNLTHLDWKATKYTGLKYAKENTTKQEFLIEGDSVKLDYIGYFKDGSQFDNSFLGNHTLDLKVDVEGFLLSFYEGLKMFRREERGYIKISPVLGYGDKPYANIPPNSTLIYYIELRED